MASLYNFSAETLSELRKFRFSSGRADNMQAIIYAIDKSSNYVTRESESPIESIEELMEELPDNSARYVLLSYPIKLSDGRIKNPFVLLYWRPPTSGQENKMLYAGAVELFREKAGVSKLIEIEEEEDFEDLEEKLV
ncbi:hypothetical protein ACI3LY_001790 [Candidozyma auris]|uniref:ADF-H domain-containing protein n=1 Tax=Candidozyma auris TaxID=498019 RepID=A0A2H0ZQL9_CANAR|nr:hypothetical protein CJI97_002530 [[Candida] auris]PIS55764.1 hypothetical protein B9J08_001869 [[Candida] auris]PSK77820.1 hypothetical protein CJJ07_002364 [[Candida] auris]QEL59532.1 hypothetical protein CJJ09_001613 [[Candida] auris]